MTAASVMDASTWSPLHERLPCPYRPQTPVIEALLAELAGKLDWWAVRERARPWVQAMRAHPAPFWAIESLLREYPLSSDEGRALMRLAEALLRVPDTDTAAALAADQLGRAAFDAGALATGSAHPLLAGLTHRVIALAKSLLPQPAQELPLGPLTDTPPHAGHVLQRLGEQTTVAAAVRAVQLLGRQFVLGRDIHEALNQADHQRHRLQPPHDSPAALRFSFDMLGEGARCEADAQRYLAAYADAIEQMAARQPPGPHPEEGDGISIKLSALFARYEEAQRSRVLGALVPRAWQLVERAATAGITLTLDAEESERLELSLDVFDALAERVAAKHPHWRGLGLAVQAYQTRSREVIDEVARLARQHQLRLMVRLVKGAYWDAEIKRAQELGLDDYPVFTHKNATDVAYLACARALLAHTPQLYPQFATHNATTLAAVMTLAEQADVGARGVALESAFEWQRLHGMGEAVHRELLAHTPAGQPRWPVRVYAPVGEHRDLLAYLVRRMLENGANASFVHQLADARVSLDQLLASPLHLNEHASVPLPAQLFENTAPVADASLASRANSRGLDLACRRQRAPLIEAVARTPVPTVAATAPDAIAPTLRALAQAAPRWQAMPLAERCAMLVQTADLLQAALPRFCGLLVHEAHKTLPDAVAEVREAIDACRYYAQQAAATLAPRVLPGPTGEHNELRLRGRGVFACIAPWNFPLAIFGAQVVAALVAGNTVAAKPAEQTPGVARAFIDLLLQAGVPADAIALLHGPGDTVGAALVADAHCAGVAFTGSTHTAKRIQRALAASDGPIVPLIAETGGINAMVVDSSALPEQVIDAALASAFGSAGQRCSSLRVLCVHSGIAERVLGMLAGAMQELTLGNPADPATGLSVDIPPVIDTAAHAHLCRHIERLERSARLIARTPQPAAWRAQHIAPVAFEIEHLADLREELFGPVLHVLRWGPSTAVPDLHTLIAHINALGWGLTLGVHTRIDSRAQAIAAQARVGNVYINRGITGAVIGVQPFGGEGLSGTGPKAGGPHYLLRFCVEQTLTINTAAASGNADLLARG